MRGGESSKSLEETPSWAVALVCTVFVVASLLLERALNALGKYLRQSNQRELYHTLDVIKNELMLLGFISLFLTVFQPKIASLCMPDKLNRIMLPCPYIAPSIPTSEQTAAASPAAAVVAHRRLSSAEQAMDSNPACSLGHVQIISVEGLHQLHIFIFVMAVIHVLYSCLTVLVGLWQVHSWKKWEVEAHNEIVKTVDEALTLKPMKHEQGLKFAASRIRYKFLHTSRTGLNLDSYVYSFFRQFGRPIYKADYLCLRMGFIAGHELNAHYDFHSYIRRSMEEDFKTVVGISTYLWAFVCVFLLLDINGWYTYFWIAFIPTILVLVVGAKLQQIITDLALEVRGGVEKIDLSTLMDLGDTEFKAAEIPKQEVVIQPMRPRDSLFWFKKPHVLVHLVHFILFQNAFELAFFFWAMFEYGFSSCLVGRRWMIVVRLMMGYCVAPVLYPCTRLSARWDPPSSSPFSIHKMHKLLSTDGEPKQPREHTTKLIRSQLLSTWPKPMPPMPVPMSWTRRSLNKAMLLPCTFLSMRLSPPKLTKKKLATITSLSLHLHIPSHISTEMTLTLWRLAMFWRRLLLHQAIPPLFQVPKPHSCISCKNHDSEPPHPYKLSLFTIYNLGGLQISNNKTNKKTNQKNKKTKINDKPGISLHVLFILNIEKSEF